MRTQGSVLFATIIAGLAFGVTLSNIGFADFTELHRMFTFQDPRMLLAFGGAVAIIAAVFAVVGVRRTPGRIHSGVVPGAVLFGTGWAITGGCPAIPIVQVASGYLPAIVTVTGIAVGVLLCRWVDSRFLTVDRGSCQT
jgi:uncharacterized membrane protein YedE/YeeE